MENTNRERLKSIVNNKIGFYAKKQTYINSSDKEFEIINRYDSNSETESNKSDLEKKLNSDSENGEGNCNKKNFDLKTDKMEFTKSIEKEDDLIITDVNNINLLGEDVRENNKIFNNEKLEMNNDVFCNNDYKENNFLMTTQSVSRRLVSVRDKFKNLDFSDSAKRKLIEMNKNNYLINNCKRFKDKFKINKSNDNSIEKNTIFQNSQYFERIYDNLNINGESKIFNENGLNEIQIIKNQNVENLDLEILNEDLKIKSKLVNDIMKNINDYFSLDLFKYFKSKTNEILLEKKPIGIQTEQLIFDDEFNQNIENIDINNLKINLIEKFEECNNTINLSEYIKNFYVLLFKIKMKLSNSLQDAPSSYCNINFSDSFIECLIKNDIICNFEFLTKLFYLILTKYNLHFSEEIYQDSKYNINTVENELTKDEFDFGNESSNLFPSNKFQTINCKKEEISVNLLKVYESFFNGFSILSSINIYIFDKFISLNLHTSEMNEENKIMFQEIIFNMLNLFNEFSCIEKSILKKSNEIFDYSNIEDKNIKIYIPEETKVNNLKDSNKLNLVMEKSNHLDIRYLLFLDFSRKLEAMKIIIEYLDNNDFNDSYNIYQKLYNCSLDINLKKIISLFVFESIAIYNQDKGLNLNSEQEISFNTIKNTKKVYKNKMTLIRSIYNSNIIIEKKIFKIIYLDRNIQTGKSVDFLNASENSSNNFIRFFTLSNEEAKYLFNLCFSFIKMKSLSNIFHKIIDLICLIVSKNMDFLDKLLDNLINMFSDFLKKNNLNSEEKNFNFFLHPKNLNTFNNFFGVYLTSDGNSISIYTLIFIKVFTIIFLQNEDWNLIRKSYNLEDNSSAEEISNSNNSNKKCLILKSDSNISCLSKKNQSNFYPISKKVSEDDSERIENYFEKAFEIFVLKIIESNNQNLLLVFYCLVNQLNILKYSCDFSISIHLLMKFFILISNLLNSFIPETNIKKYMLNLLEIIINETFIDFEEMKNNFLCLNDGNFSIKKICECFNCEFVSSNAKKISIKCHKCNIKTNLVLQIVEHEKKEMERICGICKLDKFLEEINFPKFSFNNHLEKNPKKHQLYYIKKGFKERCEEANIIHSVIKTHKRASIKEKEIIKIEKRNQKEKKKLNKYKKIKENSDSEKSFDVVKEIITSSQDEDFHSNFTDHLEKENEISEEADSKKNLYKKFLSFQENLLSRGFVFLKLSILNFIYKASLNEIFEENINSSLKVFIKILLFEVKNINFIEDTHILNNDSNSKHLGDKKIEKQLKVYMDKLLEFYYKNKDKILNRIPDFLIEESTIKTFYFYFFYANFLYAGNIKIIDIIFINNFPWGLRFKSIKMIEKFFTFEKTHNIFNNFDYEIYSTLLKDNSFHIRESSLDMIASLYSNKKYSKTQFLRILFENIDESSFLIRKKIIKILINFLESNLFKYSEKKSIDNNIYFLNIQMIFLNKLNDSTESVKIKRLIFDFYYKVFLNNDKKNINFSSKNSDNNNKSTIAIRLCINTLNVFIQLLRESSTGSYILNDNYQQNSGVFSLTMASNSFGSNFIYFDRIKLIFKNLYLDREENILDENSTNFILDHLFDEYLMGYKQAQNEMEIVSKNEEELSLNNFKNENLENLISALNLLKIISSYTHIKNYNYFEFLLILLFHKFENNFHDNMIKQIICQIFTNMLRFFDYKLKYINNLKESLIKLIVLKQISVMFPALE